MIKMWSENGFYSQYNIGKSLITNLYDLRDLELFLLDIETTKTDLFLKRGLFTRNTDKGIGSINQPQISYMASHYAKKWFPFTLIFKEYFFINQINEFKVMEISDRLELFYAFWGFCIKNIRVDNGIIHTDPNSFPDKDIRLKLKFISQAQTLESLANIEEISNESVELINEMMISYKILLQKNRKTRNLDSAFNKKKKEYTLYVKKLLEQHGSLTACSINFYMDNSQHSIDYANAKRKFLNKIRSIRNLSVFVGYIGTWEFSSKKGYYFRIIFFIPSYSLADLKNFIDLLIYQWEIFSDFSIDNEIKKIKFSAAPSYISYSIGHLKQNYCVIKHEKSKKFSDFIDSAVNYTVLAEKYFFPAELQIFLYCYIAPEKQLYDSNGQSVVGHFKYTFSRSFRGHLKKPNAEKLTLAHPSKENVRDSG